MVVLSLASVTAALLLICVAVPFTFSAGMQQQNVMSSSQEPLIEAASSGVTLQLFVMSRCPDALRCEDRMAEVLQRVHNFTRVKLYYIGAVGQDEQVSCKHGPLECTGNKQQLCAARYTLEEENFFRFYSFIRCQNAQFPSVGSPTLFQECLDKVKYPAEAQEKILQCASSSEGEGLLTTSATLSRRWGVSRSCTVHINGAHRCVMDGGAWYNCPGGSETDDFVASLCREAQKRSGTWPTECGPVPELGAQAL